MANRFKVTRALPGDSISGKLASAAVAGQLVQIKGSTVAGKTGVFHDAVEIELATGKRAFVLERDCLNDTKLPLDTIFWNRGHVSPTLVGQHASARKVQEVEVEGSDLIHSGDAQALSAATPIHSEVTSVAGKYGLRTDAATQELVGWVRGILGAQESGNTFGLLIEHVY